MDVDKSLRQKVLFCGCGVVCACKNRQRQPANLF